MPAACDKETVCEIRVAHIYANRQGYPCEQIDRDSNSMACAFLIGMEAIVVRSITAPKRVDEISSHPPGVFAGSFCVLLFFPRCVFASASNIVRHGCISGDSPLQSDEPV